MSLNCPGGGCQHVALNETALVQHWVFLHQYPTAEAYERVALGLGVSVAKSEALSEMLRDSAGRTNFWRAVLRSVAPGTVRILLRHERLARRQRRTAN
jgi:hypothetical protein